MFGSGHDFIGVNVITAKEINYHLWNVTQSSQTASGPKTLANEMLAKH